MNCTSGNSYEGPGRSMTNSLRVWPKVHRSMPMTKNQPRSLKAMRMRLRMYETRGKNVQLNQVMTLTQTTQFRILCYQEPMAMGSWCYFIVNKRI